MTAPIHVRPIEATDVDAAARIAFDAFAGIADHPFSRRFPLGVPDGDRLRGLWG